MFAFFLYRTEYCAVFSFLLSFALKKKYANKIQKLSLPLNAQLQSCSLPSTPHIHNGLGFASSKSNSPKRTLHIFDSIQSIFQSNNHHNHSFNQRHNHNHDKNHKHNHTEKSANQSHKHTSASHKSNEDSVESDRLKNDTLKMQPSDLESDAGAHSKMQNVTRILINSTNPRQSNGKYRM